MSQASHKSPPPPCAIVIFGANGDLTKRLIVPALYNLARTGLLPERFSLIGVDHNDRSTDEWRGKVHEFLEESLNRGGEGELTKIEDRYWKPISEAMSFLQGDFEKPEDYDRLAKRLAECDKAKQLGGNVLFYMATADRFFATIAQLLGKAGLVAPDGGHNSQGGFRRLIVEKPFGHDLESAKALNACLLKWLKEDQIYRIDHFLGKETVQNIMAMRFGNGLFEPIWNRDRIDHVQITVAESIGVGTRGKFYEQTGALRDMVPNHLFQLVAMTAMEPPVSFNAEDIRAKKSELFKAVHPLTLNDAVRGQYDAGTVGGEPAKAYRAEPNVAADSMVETYMAMRLTIDNWRWAGVPFYLRTGKRLNIRSSEIAIRFKQAPYEMFRDTPVEELDADWMILRIQPDEGIRLRFNAKRPGPAMALESVSMRFNYKDYFKQAPAVGYETLIYDCLIGDATLFQRADQVEAAWAVVEPVLRGWESTTPRHFPNYQAGTEGPIAANDLLARDGRSWRAIRILGGNPGRQMSGIAGKLEVVRDAGALAARAAEIIAGRLKGARYPFRLVLSGGSTPRAAYQLLACKDVDWSCAELFFSDERCVPPDHPDSNYRMVRETLLAGNFVHPRKLFAIPTDGAPQACADRYDEALRQQYGAGSLETGVPLFHLTLLGLGDDGHTASLLPGQPVLDERRRWVAAVPKGREEPRITLTYPALEASELILFLVSGAAKRDALAQVRGEEARGGQLPAGALKPHGEVLWLADAAAAGDEDQGYGF